MYTDFKNYKYKLVNQFNIAYMYMFLELTTRYLKTIMVLTSKEDEFHLSWKSLRACRPATGEGTCEISPIQIDHKIVLLLFTSYLDGNIVEIL